MARFAVYIVPRSKRPGPYGWHGGLPRLRVSAPASEGRANKEAERLLSDLLAVRAELVSGRHSRKKTFQADISDDALGRRLDDVFGRPSGRGTD